MNAINPLNPRTETVIILQGDDDETLRHLRAEVERTAPKKGAPSAQSTMDEGDPHEAAVTAYEVFAEEAADRGIKVILRALGRKTWKELTAKHPPREGNENDEQQGMNLESLNDEIVLPCMASPGGSLEERSAFLDSLNEGQYGDLALRAYWLNVGRSADPTLRLR